MVEAGGAWVGLSGKYNGSLQSVAVEVIAVTEMTWERPSGVLKRSNCIALIHC